MKVSDETRKEWKKLKEKGDNDALSELLGITPENVSKITSSGKGSLAQIKIITRFFNKKKKEMQQYS